MKYDHRVTAHIIGMLRIQKGLSQETLATKAGMARSHYAMIEYGSKRPTIETLWRITEALDMRLSELVNIVEAEIEKS